MVFFMYILSVAQIWENYIGVLLTPNLGFADKFETFLEPFSALFMPEVETPLQAVLIIVVSVLQGVVVNLMLYMKVFKKKELEAKATCKIGASTAVSDGVGAVISFFGVGCVPCKTALISPLMSIFFAGSVSVFAQTAIMIAILLIAVLLSVYSVLKMLNQLRSVTQDKVTSVSSKNKEENVG
jgi:hypothetical protein